VLLDNGYPHLYEFCLFSALLPHKYLLVSLDILLRRPATRKQRVACFVKRRLLKAVDLFLLYFKDTQAYQHWYGIDSGRTQYVPFKVNDWETFEKAYPDPCSGSYILCAGRTLRDHATFINAIGRTKLPGILLMPLDGALLAHGTREITRSALPDNLRVIVHDDGKQATFLEWIRKAAIVVIPRYQSDISSTGISTYLNAMAAARCVIISRGPGVEDVLLNQEAIVVDPENCAQLAEAMSLAWSNPDMRRTLGLAGRAYAEKLAGADRLWSDIAGILLEACQNRSR